MGIYQSLFSDGTETAKFPLTEAFLKIYNSWTKTILFSKGLAGLSSYHRVLDFPSYAGYFRRFLKIFIQMYVHC